MNEMRNFIWAGLGGMLGSMLRFGVYRMQAVYFTGSFFIGTLIVNVLGCFVIGAVSSWFEKVSAIASPMYIFVAFGILGGFTTFSAFGLDTFLLFRDGETAWAIGNIFLQITAGLSAVYLGRLLF